MAENALVRYEVLFIANPTIESEDTAKIESQFNDLISQGKGSTLSFEKWGKYHLAYEIDKKEYGVYFLSRFEVPAQGLKETLEQLRQFFAVKYSDVVLRHMVTLLAPGASLEYRRPESMEEAPRREAEGSHRKERFARRDDTRFASVQEDEEGEESSESAE